MSPRKYTDKEIIRRLQSGVKRTVEETVLFLLEKFKSIVSKIVTQMGGDGQDVEIVLNDATFAFVQFVQNGNYQKERGSRLSTLFYKFVQNIWLNIYRQRQTREKQFEKYKILRPATEAVLNDGEKDLHWEETRKMIADAIGQLDGECREILSDFWLKGKLLKAIAGELGKSEDAVKQKHRRCFKQLKKLFGENSDEYFL